MKELHTVEHWDKAESVAQRIRHNQSKGQGPGYQIYLFLVCENFKSKEIGMVIYVSKKKRGWGM